MKDLSREYWDAYLETHPEEATVLGDPRHHGRVRDLSPEGLERARARLRDLLRRAEASALEALDAGDRVTRTALLHQIRSDLAELESGMETWNVDPMTGPHIDFPNLPAYQPLTGRDEAGAMLERWRALGPAVAQRIDNLARGLDAGRTATVSALERVVASIDDLEARPVESWTLVADPASRIPADWPPAERTRFLEDLTAAVAGGFRPALLRYRDFLRDEVLPAARSDDEPGILHVEGGAEAYPRLIRAHTSLDFTPSEIHMIGRDEVSRIDEETRALGAKLFGTSDLEEIHRRLREDPAVHFTTRDEVAEKAESALRRAEAAVPEWFGRLPKAPCTVVRMEPHEEKHSTIAYYQRPSVDGSRPGRYYINTYAPETRPRYEAEALAYHEAVPGHHTQIAIAQELAGLPEFRKHLGVTAFVEGWGLYAERLADEMGLYSGDLDRMGMLSFDAWRACRLVVDTGMHALGWSRETAIEFMLRHTVLAENNIVNEVDRYIAWPGQALGYMLGKRHLLKLRDRARTALGKDFDLRAFHDVVLGQGAVDLATLTAMVEGWIAAR